MMKMNSLCFSGGHYYLTNNQAQPLAVESTVIRESKGFNRAWHVRRSTLTSTGWTKKKGVLKNEKMQ